MKPSHGRSIWWVGFRFSVTVLAGMMMLAMIPCAVLYHRAMLPPEITISRETTYFTEPIGADGMVDYFAALNARYGAGVTPENNFMVSFWQAMGPGEFRYEDYKSKYFTLLHSAPPAKDGTYFVTWDDFSSRPENTRRIVQPDPYAYHATPPDYESPQATPGQRPWSTEEFPVISDWLSANEKPLSILVDGSHLPKRFNPLLPNHEEDGLLSHVWSKASTAMAPARALTVRALRSIHEGKTDDAWSDLLACHRIARLTAQGAELWDLRFAATIDSFACQVDQILLQHGRLTSDQLAQIRKDLAQLSTLPPQSEKIEIGERCELLQQVAHVARHGFLYDNFEIPNAKWDQPEHFSDTLLRGNIDWDIVLRMSNEWMDRFAKLSSLPIRADRDAAEDLFLDDLQKLEESTQDGTFCQSLLDDSKQAVSERIGRMFVCHRFNALYYPRFNAEDFHRMNFAVTTLAFDLAAYHADHGSYPEKLSELVPGYAAEIPLDLYTNSELHYHRIDDGYLLYSVGEDGEDNHGRTYAEEHAYRTYRGWDISMRMPAASAVKSDAK